MTGRTRVALHAALATLAAASALGGVFHGYGWLLPTIGIVLVVALVSEAVRWTPIPSLFGPVLAAAAALCYLDATNARAESYGGVFPTGQSMSTLGALARSGLHDIKRLATPVPTHPGLVLVTTVAIGAVALVVDLLAVTMRRAALAGAPLLAVFAVCTSVGQGGVGWVPFVIGSVGYLWLLLADNRDRLNRWGRPLGFDRVARPHFTWSDTEVMPSPLAVMGRRIGGAAIAVAVVLPLAVPGLRGGIPHHGSGLGFGGSRSHEAVTVNPLVDVAAELRSPSDIPLLSVRSTDPDPGYLRLTSLDRFDGSSFSSGTLQATSKDAVSHGIPAPAVSGRTLTDRVQVLALAVHWLPVPSPLLKVQVKGGWLYDRPTATVFSAQNDTHGLTYTALGTVAEPAPAALEQATAVDPSVEGDLSLPTIDPQIRALAHRVVAKAATPFDKAIAIQRYLTSAPFTYATQGTPTGPNALSEFLLRSHAGFCQQFATSMAVLARIDGIPSRVAVGFTQGNRQRDGSWTITSHDAHAWPELYFSGFGWLAFEPTPRADGQAVAPAYTLPHTSTKPTGSNQGSSKAGSAPHQSTSIPSLSKLQHLDQADDQRGRLGRVIAAHRSGASIRARVATGFGVLLLLLAAFPWVLRRLTRRRRWRGATTVRAHASAAWSELAATLVDYGIDWPHGLSPRAAARIVQVEAGELDPVAQLSLDQIVATVERAWYAAPDATAADDLRPDVELIRRTLSARLRWPRRVVLGLWPRSALHDTRAGLARLAGWLDAADLAGARLRARLTGS